MGLINYFPGIFAYFLQAVKNQGGKATRGKTRSQSHTLSTGSLEIFMSGVFVLCFVVVWFFFNQFQKTKKTLTLCLRLGIFLFCFSLYLASLFSLKIPMSYDVVQVYREPNRFSFCASDKKHVPMVWDRSETVAVLCHLCGISIGPQSFRVLVV